jgi:hypothetical protein
MDWVVVGVQWMHVLLGILWFGTVLSLDVIVIPAINRLPIVAQRDVSSAIAARATPLFHVVVPTIIILGMIRGTLLGPIRSVDALLGTAYGLTWLVALAATVGTYLWGLLVLVPAIRAMDAAPLAPDGAGTPTLVAATDRVKGLIMVELVGFAVVFTCMILMRFGL